MTDTALTSFCCKILKKMRSFLPSVLPSLLSFLITCHVPGIIHLGTAKTVVANKKGLALYGDYSGAS